MDDATTEDDAIVLLASDSAVHTTRAIACRCNTIKNILEDSSDEDTVIPLPAVDAATLRIVLLLLASHDEIDAVLGQDADELKLLRGFISRLATSLLRPPTKSSSLGSRPHSLRARQWLYWRLLAPARTLMTT